MTTTGGRQAVRPVPVRVDAAIASRDGACPTCGGPRGLLALPLGGATSRLGLACASCGVTVGI